MPDKSQTQAGGVPAFLINSLPKSGTHLLQKAVGMLLPGVEFSDIRLERSSFDESSTSAAGPAVELFVDCPASVPVSFVEAMLRGVGPAQYALTHIPHSPAMARLVERLRMKTLTILRDPRDVVVSHARFIAETPTHFLREAYAAMDPQERVTKSIEGLEATSSRPGMLDIATRCWSVVAWSNEPCNCTLRFEDLVGPQGGGSHIAQVDALRRITRHLGESVGDEDLMRIAKDLFGGTLTFRKGEIGSWRQNLSPEHKRLFKRVAGDVLVEMGYERSLDW